MTENTPKSQDEKLRILADSLVPYLDPLLFTSFLDRLKNEGFIKESTSKLPASKETTPAKHSIYMPELDYFIWEASYSNTLRHGWITAKNKIRLEVSRQTSLVHPIGLSIPGGNNDARRKYIIPIATLKESIDHMYDTSYTLDYRIAPESRSMYMKGIMDVARDHMPAAGNLRVRDINFGFEKDDPYYSWARYMDEAEKPAKALDEWAFREWARGKHLPWDNTSTFQRVLIETRAHWGHMPEDGGRSIVTKATMMELLDGLENRTLIPGQIQWHIDIMQSGAPNTLPYHEMDKTDWLNPQKISIKKGV